MVELLGQAELKTGQTIVIKHSSTLALSPAYTVFLREMANLMDNGHAFAGTSWQDIHCGIIWGEVDGEIAGIFAYSRQDIDRDQLINIVLTAVVQQYRQ